MPTKAKKERSKWWPRLPAPLTTPLLRAETYSPLRFETYGPPAGQTTPRYPLRTRTETAETPFEKKLRRAKMKVDERNLGIPRIQARLYDRQRGGTVGIDLDARALRRAGPLPSAGLGAGMTALRRAQDANVATSMRNEVLDSQGRALSIQPKHIRDLESDARQFQSERAWNEDPIGAASRGVPLPLRRSGREFMLSPAELAARAETPAAGLPRPFPGPDLTFDVEATPHDVEAQRGAKGKQAAWNAAEGLRRQSQETANARIAEHTARIDSVLRTSREKKAGALGRGGIRDARAAKVGVGAAADQALSIARTATKAEQSAAIAKEERQKKEWDRREDIKAQYRSKWDTHERKLEREAETIKTFNQARTTLDKAKRVYNEEQASYRKWLAANESKIDQQIKWKEDDDDKYREKVLGQLEENRTSLQQTKAMAKSRVNFLQDIYESRGGVKGYVTTEDLSSGPEGDRQDETGMYYRMAPGKAPQSAVSFPPLISNIVNNAPFEMTPVTAREIMDFMNSDALFDVPKGEAQERLLQAATAAKNLLRSLQ